MSTMTVFADGLNQGLSFIVRNNAPQGKSLSVFNYRIGNGRTLDLMKIPGISEDDIKASLVKGELGRKLKSGYLQVVSSTLIFDSLDPAYTALLVSFGLSASTGGAGEGLVANIAALTLINDANEVDGAEREVSTLQQLFKLDKSGTSTIDGITVVATKSGTGRWLRVLSASPRWTNQFNWWVDSAAGNDENTGASSGAAVKTIAEFCRRMKSIKSGDTTIYTVNIMNDLPADDTYCLSALVEPGDTDGNVLQVSLLGQRTSVFSGTTGAGCLITDTATNTQAIFDGGVGFVPATHVGKLIELADGTVCWVTKDLGGTLAQVTEYEKITVDTSFSPSLQAAPGTGVAYNVMDLTKYEGEFTSLGSTMIRHKMQNLHFTANGLSESFTFKSNAASVATCLFERRPGHGGANGTYYVCMFNYPTLTTVAFVNGCDFAIIGCGFIKAELVPLDTTMILIQETHFEGGYIRGGITTSATPAFGGAFSAANAMGGNFIVRGTRGLGIFNSPAGHSGLSLRRNSHCFIKAPLYGQGNDGYGVDVAEGCKMIIQSSITPTITGTVGDLLLEHVGEALPPLESSAGGSLPSLAPLTTWADWTSSPFNRNALSYKSGAAIGDGSST